MESEDEIVISGISGRFPEANTMEEFWQNLLQKKDMVTEDDRRWKPGLFGLPRRNGKLCEIDQFDSNFFGVHAKQAQNMDPQQRMLMEVSYEAIYDAGIDPFSLAGTNTGVWVGVSSAESKESLSRDPETLEGYIMTGCCTAMFANRLSFFYDFKGPSMSIDTACSSSLLALQMAFEAIKNGSCDGALVAGTNLVLKPQTSLQFQRLGMLSENGTCRSFDSNGKGYVRSETVAAIYISKKSAARTHYCSVVNAVTNTDGRKEQGITFPSGEMQKRLLASAYSETGIDINSVAYMEAHGTGTKAGDPQELNAITDVLCEGRKSPLLIGSVKSNMGHAEPASGVASVAKCILAMQNGVIPPNLHFTIPNSNIPGLSDGRLQVVTNPTPLPDGLISINSFGFGGSNVHVILKPNKLPLDIVKTDGASLVLLNGRTENGIKDKQEFLQRQDPSQSSITAMNSLSIMPVSQQPYRGYLITNVKDNKVQAKSVTKTESTNRPVWFVMTGMGAQWRGMGINLMTIPIFKKAIDNCSNALSSYNIDVAKLFSDATDVTFNDTVSAFVGLASIQIGIIDILSACGVTPDGVLGHSVGELACGYADGSLNLEQAVQAAYCRGRCIKDSDIESGAMAAVGLSWKECKDICPENVTPACHNAADSVTISGPCDAVEEFVSSLKEKKIFAKIVHSSGVAFHSPVMKKVYPKFVKELRKIIPSPKPRSTRWISSSFSSDKWEDKICQQCSAEYHANNLISPVLFQEALTYVPDDAVVIEIGPHSLLQAILKRSLPKTCALIPLTKRQCTSEIDHLLAGLGKLYMNGVNINLEKIQGKFDGPCGIMLSNLVDWDHSQTWPVPTPESFITGQSLNMKHAAKLHKIDISKESSDHYLVGHKIDGRILFPATGYIVLVWKTLANHLQMKYDELPACFEDLVFHRATVLSETEITSLEICITPSSDEFRISDGDNLVVSGKVYIPSDAFSIDNAPDMPAPNGKLVLQKSNIYKMLRLAGYQYNDKFQGVETMHQNGVNAELEWIDNWVTFLDSLLQTIVLSSSRSELRLPTRIRKLVLVPQSLKSSCVTKENSTVISTYTDRYTNTTTAGSIVQVTGLHSTAVQRRQFLTPVLEEYKFIPLFNENSSRETFIAKSLLDVAIENRRFLKSLKVVDVRHKKYGNETDLHCYNHMNSHITIEVDYMVCGGESNTSELTHVTWDPFANQHLPADVENCDILIMYQALAEGNGLVTNALNCLHKRGFLILHESLDFVYSSEISNTDFSSSIDKKIKHLSSKYDLIVVGYEILNDNKSIWILCRKQQNGNNSNQKNIGIQNGNFTWLDDLKNCMSDSVDKSTIWLHSNDPKSGIIGLVNCLRQEPGGNRIRCAFHMSGNKEKLSDSEWQLLYQRDLAMNILKDGIWGTYRHVTMINDTTVKQKLGSRGYVDVLTRGDLSSLRWISESHTSDKKAECKVAYAALNFRDIMLASGKLSSDAIPGDTLKYKTLIGMEYSGWDDQSNRIMGLLAAEGLSTHVYSNKQFCWNLPDNCSLQEACTIPVVYSTAYYALIVRGRLKYGESVLIHSGSGGVGQAAIAIALSMSCQIFTTVSNHEKRNYLKERFPQLSEDTFSNSRDSSFETDIMKKTNGRGVDIVLNSLSGELLLASVRCVAKHGRFLEIGKYDLSNNSKLGMSLFLRNVTFHGILLDSLFDDGNREWNEVYELVNKGLQDGTVRPLKSTVFSRDEVESAFRYMAQGKHIGKVLIEVRNDMEEIVEFNNATPRFTCHPEKVYLISGGLGGFGLRLCNWLVGRGARKLVVTSRSGVTTAYQQQLISSWKKENVEFVVSNLDVRSMEGTRQLLDLCCSLGEVAAVFHLAMVLRDAMLSNQTMKTFEDVCAIKAEATKNLDTVTREMCPQLEFFVGFSSVVSGRGNIGQTNYGLANSAIERVCENRFNQGLPGLAIQWGAIGDVGVLVDKIGEQEVGGTLPQKMPSCLSVLDTFLCQRSSAIVSSYVPAQKKTKRGTNESKTSSVVDKVANILGIQNIASIDKDATLGNLGLDSLMSVEVQQTLERLHGTTLSQSDIRLLTFAKLDSMSGKNKDIEKNKDGEKQLNKGEEVAHPAEIGSGDGKWINKETANQFGIVLKSDVEKPVNVIRLNDCQSDTNPWFIIHPIEGSASVLKELGKHLDSPVYGIQCTDEAPLDTIKSLASFYLTKILKTKATGPYNIAGYSFGACVAFEMALQLQARKENVITLVLLDSSHSYVSSRVKIYTDAIHSVAEKESSALSSFIKQIIPDVNNSYMELRDNMIALHQLDDRLNYTVNIISERHPQFDSESVKSAARRYYRCLDIANEYKVNEKYNSELTLVRTTENAEALSEDYNLSSVCTKPVVLHTIECSHKELIRGKNAKRVADILYQF